MLTNAHNIKSPTQKIFLGEYIQTLFAKIEKFLNEIEKNHYLPYLYTFTTLTHKTFTDEINKTVVYMNKTVIKLFCFIYFEE